MTNAHPRWEAMWEAGIGPGQAFDTGSASPVLVQLIDANAIPEGRALVPGCGRGYDVLALASAKRTVIGLDIAELAVSAARNRIEALPSAEAPFKESMEFRQASFFDLPSDDDQKFDFIYDYTFLCALDLELRDQWAQKMADLVRPGGELMTLIFPISETKEGGPPFKVSLKAVKELLVNVGFEEFQLELLPSELCHAGRDGINGPYSRLFNRWAVLLY
eukprot:CAMPEP_0119040280 /NCGR_PEP_ID=MMETSP1177-20130426/10154_1 /TAXON_ID=2985 /ORGANISM="Ochromonas sp, Strain CCMP1899" /LENGTH=218 /DNA_ID=CAMNT_0007005181 /DNA_START=203 /DNA_END=856 /DNA_ORIENTATION=-